jgi:hypothetical protein
MPIADRNAKRGRDDATPASGGVTKPAAAAAGKPAAAAGCPACGPTSKQLRKRSAAVAQDLAHCRDSALDAAERGDLQGVVEALAIARRAGTLPWCSAGTR